MMKLLKYDWKRNSNALVSMAAILVFVEIMLLVVAKWNNWIDTVVYGGSFIGFVGATVMIFITMCKTYDHNITAYSRRLLPIPALYTIASPLLLGFLSFLVVVVIAILHGLLFTAVMGIDENIMSIIVGGSSTVWQGLLISFLVSIYFSITVLFSITVARTVRSRRKGVWLGIAVFFGISTLVSWIENIVFSGSDSTVNEVTIESSNTAGSLALDTSNWNFINNELWGRTLIETIVTALLVYFMVKLLNKKVQ